MITFIAFLLALAAFCGIGYAIYRLYNSDATQLVKTVAEKQKEEKPEMKTYAEGLRVGGLVEISTVLESFMLTAKGLTFKLPEITGPLMINQLTRFSLFDLDIYRAYLDSGLVLQLNTEGGKVVDRELYNIVMDEKGLARDDYNNWNKMVYGKNIRTPDGIEYISRWDSTKSIVENLLPGNDYRRFNLRTFGRETSDETVEMLVLEVSYNDPEVRVLVGIAIDPTDVKII